MENAKSKYVDLRRFLAGILGTQAPLNFLVGLGLFTHLFKAAVVTSPTWLPLALIFYATHYFDKSRDCK